MSPSARKLTAKPLTIWSARRWMREDGVDQRQEPAEEHRHQEPDDPAAAPDRPPDAEEGPGQHHPLEPDVHDAGALGEDAAHRGERERRREAERRGEHPRGEDAVERRPRPSPAARRSRVVPAMPRPIAHQPSFRSPRGTAAIPQRDRDDARREGPAGLLRIVHGGSASQKANTPKPIPSIAIVRGSVSRCRTPVTDAVGALELTCAAPAGRAAAPPDEAPRRARCRRSGARRRRRR